MTRDEFICILNEVGWDKKEFIVLAGGSLLLRGIREETRDFDLSISKDFARKIKLHEFPKNSHGSYIAFKDAEVKDNLESHSFDMVSGFKCQDLLEIIRYKKNRKTPKDEKDLLAIQRYMDSSMTL
jgi:hypothetical protein